MEQTGGREEGEGLGEFTVVTVVVQCLQPLADAAQVAQPLAVTS
jgi:hypothetical protein